MDIDRIRYFCVFADTGSLVRASELLRISQPALSKAMKLLETEMGCRLLEPDGRGLRLTESGRQLKSSAQPLLNQWMEIPGRLQGIKRKPVTRLASFEVFTTYFLGPLMKQLPLANLEVQELAPGKLEEAVASGQVDIGVTYVPIPKPHVVFTEASRIKMGVFGLKSFRSSTDLLPFVIPAQPLEGTPSKVTGLDGWPDHLYPRRIDYRVTLMESAMELCRQGVAVAYLPEFVVKLHNDLVKPQYALVDLGCAVPVANRWQRVFIVQRATESETATVKAIARALRSLRRE